MSKRRNALDAADPAHPDHDRPVWDCGDIGRFCRVHPRAVWQWVQDGLLTPDADAGTGERRHPRFRPAAVIAATEVRRFPVRRRERV